MPSSSEILGSLAEIANTWQMLAIFWHLYFAVLVASLLWGIRLSGRVLGILLALPLFSVSVLAWSVSNPFNGTVFALVGVALVLIAWTRLPHTVSLASPWIVATGGLMFLFGWVYPHFLESPSWLPYLYAAPTGLIPCPTLAIVIGMSLMVGGFDSRAWSLVLGATGLFYAIFGALRLGVTLDLFLLIGALVTILIVYLPHHSVHKPVPAH